MSVSARRWSQVALAAAVLTGAVLAVAPTRTSESCEATDDGPEDCSTDRESLLTGEGAAVVAVLAVPVVIAAIPVLLPRRRARLASASMLTMAALVSLASVGLFLIPTLIPAWLAFAADRSP